MKNIVVLNLDSQSSSTELLKHESDNIIYYLFLSNVWTFLLVFLPVMIEIQPNNYYVKHENWYSGNDVMRLIEPIGGLPWNFLILMESGIFQQKNSIERLFIISVFIFGGTIYGQGIFYKYF